MPQGSRSLAVESRPEPASVIATVIRGAYSITFVVYRVSDVLETELRAYSFSRFPSSPFRCF